MFRERTYKQIEASRNARLWITQVALPVAGIGATVFATLYNNNLEFRYHVNMAANNVRDFFNKKKED